MIRKYLLLVFVLSVSKCIGQNYEAKIMSWNVLNWPSNTNLVTDTTNRCPAYRTVVNYIAPDVLITMENTSVNSPIWFLDQVMNTGPLHYEKGTYINGYDTDNAIYYRDSLFDFLGNHPIQTALRDINQFTLRYKATGDTLLIYSLHLKASLGFETERGAEVDNLRQVTNALPAGTNFIVGGDFNVYEAAEPAYVKLLQDNTGDDGNFLDVLHLTGVWNNYNYRDYHTQSTHVGTAGGFSGGGLDDRFDMILYSNAVAQPGGAYYVPGSYLNVGNDGNHFNQDINNGTNTSVPSAVADALFTTSDHIPITMTLRFGDTSGIDAVQNNATDVNVYPDPIESNSKIRFDIQKKCNFSYSVSDCAGRVIMQSGSEVYVPGEHIVPVNWENIKSPGFYFMTMSFDNSLINKKLIVVR